MRYLALTATLLGGCSLSELDRFYLAPDGAAPPDACMDPANPCDGKCGMLSTVCMTHVMCGDCPQGQTCGGGGPNICGMGSCVPDCNGKPCGASDGCSGLCGNGSCATGLHCTNFMCTCDSSSCSGCCSANQCFG